MQEGAEFTSFSISQQILESLWLTNDIQPFKDNLGANSQKTRVDNSFVTGNYLFVIILLKEGKGLYIIFFIHALIKLCYQDISWDSFFLCTLQVVLWSTDAN